jgi:hypothetical protein
MDKAAVAEALRVLREKREKAQSRTGARDQGYNLKRVLNITGIATVLKPLQPLPS